jgi:hypothetical protein
MTERRLAIAKKVSLAGIGPDWGDECYAYVMPANYNDMLEAEKLDELSKAEQVKFQLDFIKRHFVSGKIRVMGEEDLADMEPDDVMASVALTDRVFMAILGDDIDPKEADPAAGRPSAPASDDKPTGTPSSTEAATFPTNTSEK